MSTRTGGRRAAQRPAARMARPLVAIAALAVLLAGIAWPSARAFAAGPMGINGFDVSGSGALPTRASIDALAAAGAGWVRVEFNTAPFGGETPGFYAAYDQLINDYRSDGIHVLGLVDYETYAGSQADWQANNAEHDGGDGDNNYIRGFAEAVAAIAAHFQGRISYYEVWNEPNCWSQQPSPGVFTGCTYIYPSNFSAMLTEVYAQSKIYNHFSVQFVSGGLFGHSIGNVYNCSNAGASYLAATYQEGNATGKFGWARANDGGHDPLDAVGEHLYISQGGAVSAAQVQQYLNCIHHTQMADDTTAKKIWVTEFGWTTASVSPAQQAANLTTAFQAVQNSGLAQSAFWFTNQDFPGGNYGIFSGGCDVTQASCRKPSYTNFQNATSYQGRFANGTTDAGILRAYTNDGGQALFGSPLDNGGGPYVHAWVPGNVQDFAGGSAGPSIFVDAPDGTFFVNYGFRTAYITQGKVNNCKAPTDNAYAVSGGTRQDFVTCYMTWTPSGGVVVHPT